MVRETGGLDTSDLSRCSLLNLDWYAHDIQNSLNGIWRDKFQTSMPQNRTRTAVKLMRQEKWSRQLQVPYFASYRSGSS